MVFYVAGHWSLDLEAYRGIRGPCWGGAKAVLSGMGYRRRSQIQFNSLRVSREHMGVKEVESSGGRIVMYAVWRKPLNIKDNP